MIAEQARDLSIGEALDVNFAGLQFWLQNAVPQRTEQRAVAALAKAIGALGLWMLLRILWPFALIPIRRVEGQRIGLACFAVFLVVGLFRWGPR